MAPKKQRYGDRLVDLINKSLNKVEKTRVRHFGPSPEWVKKTNSFIDKVVNNTPLGLLDEGAAQIGGQIADKANVNPALGALLMGAVVPGQGGEAKALKNINKPKRPVINNRTVPGIDLPKGADGKALPGRERIFKRDGKTYAWFPTKAPKGIYIDPTGRVRKANLDETGGGWQLREVKQSKGPDGELITETIDDISEVRKISRTKLPGSVNRNAGPRRDVDTPRYDPDATPPQRRFVEGADNSLERMQDIDDVNTSDMSRRVSDGNQYMSPQYGGEDLLENIPLTQTSRIRKERLDTRRSEAVQKAIDKRLKDLDVDTIEAEVFMADGNHSKLKAIAKQIDSKIHKKPSDTERAIKKRLSSLKQTYGDKPSLTKDQRQKIDDQFDRENLTGATQSERNRMADLASQDFGKGSTKRRKTRKMGDSRLKGNRRMDEIDRRIDARRGSSRSVRPIGGARTRRSRNDDFSLREESMTWEKRRSDN